MDARAIFGQRLGGWDVIAAFLGMGVAAATHHFTAASGTPVYWFGSVAVAWFVRRRFFPQLSPPEAPATPATPGRRIVGFVLMVSGGFVMLFSGIAGWFTVQDGAPLPIVITLAVFTLALWLATLGFRRVA